jgi:hypothetical protein
MHRRFLAEPFSLSEIQATYLTSMPIRAFSEGSRVEFEQEARRLRAEVGAP